MKKCDPIIIQSWISVKDPSPRVILPKGAEQTPKYSSMASWCLIPSTFYVKINTKFQIGRTVYVVQMYSVFWFIKEDRDKKNKSLPPEQLIAKRTKKHHIKKETNWVEFWKQLNCQSHCGGISFSRSNSFYSISMADPALSYGKTSNAGLNPFPEADNYGGTNPSYVRFPNLGCWGLCLDPRFSFSIFIPMTGSLFPVSHSYAFHPSMELSWVDSKTLRSE